jgi:cold shock CspA family protein
VTPKRLWRSNLPAARTGGGRLSGTVTRWDPGATCGFITGEDATSYFLSRDDLPRGYAELPAGTAVTFSAGLAPAPGERYLRARAVRLEGGAAT